MAEPTVRVPVSLIEQEIRVGMQSVETPKQLARRIETLLSQPTPTAEDDFIKRIRNTTPRTDQSAFDMETQRPLGPPAAPPSIADMVPGTTFRDDLGVVYLRMSPREDDFVLTDSRGYFWFAYQIDPSTIRDVTPPKET